MHTPPEPPTGVANAPLAGVRIIAIEQFGAGPFATLYLADLGAEIIKVEDPRAGGDVGRYVPPGQTGTDSLYFETFNRGKRSVALDLKSVAGRAVFERLVERSDVVFNNLRGDLVEGLGLTYEHLGKINPAIVCASLSAYGRTGPRRAYPGYDALIQAEAGWASLTGEPDGPPVKSGLSLVDYAAGLVAALGLMVALFDAKRTGRGCDADTNLYDVALALLTYPATWLLSQGITTERRPFSSHPSITPFQFFETADGHIAVACPKEKFFQLLAPAIGLPELLGDPRFLSFEARRVHRQELVDVLNEVFRQRTTAEWMTALEGRVPVSPVRSLAQALAEDELSERGLLVEYEHTRLGAVREVGTPLRIGGFEPSYRRAPTLDEHGPDIVRQLGYGPQEAAALGAAGAFGPLQASAATPATEGLSPT